MKVSIVPAQITTVEDRITANLSFTQLILLSIPLFLTALIFFLFPPIDTFSLYKLVVSILITSVSASLAIRVKDKLLLDLIKLRAKYALRPNLYVYRKQGLEYYEVKYGQTIFYHRTRKPISIRSTIVSSKATDNSSKLLKDANYKVAFKSKRGGLSVEVRSA